MFQGNMPMIIFKLWDDYFIFLIVIPSTFCPGVIMLDSDWQLYVNICHTK